MVEYLKIKGKEYPVKIGYYVMKKVKEKTGEDSLTKAIQKHKEDLELYETMLYAALVQGAWEEEQELDLKEEEMEMALGSCFLEFVEIVGSTKFFPKAEEGEQAEPGKGQKKPQPKRTRKT